MVMMVNGFVNGCEFGDVMVTLVYESEQVSVPSWVVDLESFRRWVDCDEFPENGRIWYHKGEVYVDMSREQIFTHVHVKTQYAVVLGGVANDDHTGLYLTDGAFLTNRDADISGKPDGMFVSYEAMEKGLLRLIEGHEEGILEIDGSPDMVLGILSKSSVQKDTEILFDAYWQANIREYWLVDARQMPLRFDIYRHAAKGYVATRKQNGWVKSAVFGKSFRLTQKTHKLGHPEFTLAVR